MKDIKELQDGTYIFSDIEHLDPVQAEQAVSCVEQLFGSKRENHLFNHPTRSMRRDELLRNLYELGLNQFNVYRLTEARMPQRFPVFIRGEVASKILQKN